MKKIILSLSLLLLTTTSYSFESGTYVCKILIANVTYILKPNGRAKEISLGQTTARGYWQDDDDAAIIIKDNQIIEDKGHGKYIFNNMFPCTKVK